MLPSGKRLHSEPENHHCLKENPLFLWPFSIAMLVHQRVLYRVLPNFHMPSGNIQVYSHHAPCLLLLIPPALNLVIVSVHHDYNKGHCSGRHQNDMAMA